MSKERVHNLNGIISCSKGVFQVKIPVIIFKEDKTVIAFCPLLDLSGYGQSELKAKESFQIVLEEYLRYVSNKNTFEEDLIGLGWTVVNAKKKSFSPPSIEKVLSKNKEAREIYNTKPFKQYNESLSISI